MGNQATFTSSHRVGRLVATEPDKIYVPTDWQYANKKRCVIWGHGAGGTYAIGPVERSMMKLLGTVWIAGTFGGGDSNLRRWGDDASCANIIAAFEWAKANLGVRQDKFIFWGGSMGGQTAHCVSFYDAAKVAAIGTAIAAFDPEYVRANDINGMKASIETVYGANPVPAAKQIATRGAAFAALNIPSILHYTTDDQFTPVASYNAFIAAAGAAVTPVNMGAIGHSYSGSGVDVSAANFLRPFIEP